MPLANSLRQLFRDLSSQKLRTFLTTCGIVWGTVAVSLLLAFSDALHGQLRLNQAGIGRGIVINWPSMTSIPYQGLGKGRPIRLDEEDIRLIRRRSLEVGPISSEYQTSLRMQLGPKTLSVDVAGVHPAFAEMRSIIPQSGGRFINPIDMDLRRRVAFLGDELAEQLYGSNGAVGQTLKLGGSPFTVIGVMARKVQDSSYSGRDKEKIFVPATTLRAITGEKYMDLFIYTARNLERTEAAKVEVLSILASKHRFHPEDEEALEIWDTTEMAQFLDLFMLAFKIFLGIVGSLTLVVGGIGVSNIMNVVVEERTREIGVKMALGARSRSIMGQFLLETLIVTFVGGVIGVLVTAGICAIFPVFDLTEFVGDPVVSPGVAAATAALLGLIGLIAGYFPARFASRLDPVVAMKV
jgi:putative ABC transport system permease protein